MNDLMSVGLHRAWKDALVTAVNPPRHRPFALLDVAGGTGDVAFRVVAAGGPDTRATVCDINADMLAVGRERAAARRSTTRSPSPKAMPRRCRLPTAASTPRPSLSASATCRASSARWPKRIACSESAAVSFASNSPPSTCRASTGSTISIRSTSSRALGRMVTGDAESYRYLVESIRHFPKPQVFAEMMRARRLCPRFGPTDDRRHRGAAFRLAFVISGAAHLLRLGPRRLRVRARGRVRRRRSGHGAAAGAPAVRAWRG